MTATTFPAQPGTFMLTRDATVSPPAVIRVPVVGWNHIQGNMAYPICVMNHGGLTHGKAILHPEGFVTDTVNALVFSSVDEWMAFLKTAKKKPSVEDEAPDVENGEDDMNEALVEDRDGLSEIEFGKKSYKTKSYWHMSDAGVIFEIDGGTPYPTDERCEKITRGDFTELKRDGVAVIDPHDIPGDDDDAMDLV